MSSTLVKWAAAAAGILALGAVPALASHVTHKHLAATSKTAHGLITSTTPLVGSAKTHKLHVAAAPAKKLTVTHKKTTKLSTKGTHKKLTTHKHTALKTTATHKLASHLTKSIM